MSEAFDKRMTFDALQFAEECVHDYEQHNEQEQGAMTIFLNGKIHKHLMGH